MKTKADKSRVDHRLHRYGMRLFSNSEVKAIAQKVNSRKQNLGGRDKTPEIPHKTPG